MLLSYFALLLIDYRRLREVLYKRPFIAIPMHLFTSPYSLTIENALRLCNWNLNRAKSIAQVLSVFTSHIHSPYVILYSKLQQQPFILHVSALEHASNKQITYEYHTCYCSTKARAPPLSMACHYINYHTCHHSTKACTPHLSMACHYMNFYTCHYSTKARTSHLSVAFHYIITTHATTAQKPVRLILVSLFTTLITTHATTAQKPVHLLLV